MALMKTLAQRLFNIYRITSPSLASCRITPPATATKALATPIPNKIAPDPGDDGIFRRFLHRSSSGISPELRSLPIGEGLIEKLRGMDIARDRIRLDGLRPPVEVKSETHDDDEEEKGMISVEDAKKLLRLSQLDMVKARLRQIEKNWISQEDFFASCGEGYWSREQAKEFAKMLDDSGSVIVLGNFVFLRPEQVLKAIQGIIPVPIAHPNDPRLKELEALEEQKAAIDKKADSMVRTELWCGLGYLIIQTAAFMRLTFWELTWDVMEPICFYVTSIYFMAGYAFFLKTSKEPSFEGFFQSRLSSKQKRLMKIHNFDIERYNELRKACCRPSKLAAAANAASFTSWGNNDAKKTQFQDMVESEAVK